jgi:hypothetical protein
MTNDRKRPPNRSEAGLAEAREREARLSGALRDNLLKRKQQQRGRVAEAKCPEGAETPAPAEKTLAREP